MIAYDPLFINSPLGVAKPACVWYFIMRNGGMAMAYQQMLDSAFEKYYTRFRELRATSEENAVTREELFPEGESVIDRDRMHKMLSMNIVRRVGLNRYWLDEKRASDGTGVLRQRIIMIVIAIILGLTIGILSRMGILNF